MEPARAELRAAGGRAADPARAAEHGRGSAALTSTDAGTDADADDQQHSPARPRRTYRSPRRAEQAAATRAAILASAHELFVANGYAATTVADIARHARVAVDTVYATVGKKPDVLREVLETAISGSNVAVPAEQRDYVLRVRQASTADAKIRAYVDGLIALQPRLAPVVLALRDAAGTDPESAAQWQRIADRRARNMRQFAADLRATGELREDLTDDDVADIVWSMNGPEYWTLLVGERGWTAERFGDHVVDAWQRILLAAPRSSRASRG